MSLELDFELGLVGGDGRRAAENSDHPEEDDREQCGEDGCEVARVSARAVDFSITSCCLGFELTGDAGGGDESIAVVGLGEQ